MAVSYMMSQAVYCLMMKAMKTGTAGVASGADTAGYLQGDAPAVPGLPR
ncbi:hypothetical protein [Endozoicomonas sp.]